MRSLLRVVLLSAAFALGTVAMGWYALPAIALIWGAAAHRDRATPAVAAAAAAIGWSALLALAAARGPVSELAAAVSSVLGVPAVALVLVTLVLPALVAWSAARLAQGVTEAARPVEQSGR